MLITASYCLSAVEANDNNQTNQTSPAMESTSSDKTTLEGAKLVGAIVSYCLSVVEAIDNNQTDRNSQSHCEDESTLNHIIAIVGSVVGVLGFLLAVVKIYFLKKKIKEQKKNPM